MASTRKLLGRLSPEQAVRFVMGKPGQIQTGRTLRMGRKIQLERKSTRIERAPDQQQAQQALQRFGEWIEAQAATARTPKRQQELKHYREMHRFLEHFGGVQPTAYQLAAALALTHGITTEQLTPHLKPLVTTQVRRPTQAYWQGSITNAMKALNRDLPARIEQILYENKEILDSKEICKKLGLDWNMKNQNNLNAALQLLDQSKLARKEPTHSTNEHGTSRSTWTHAAHPALPIRHPNTQLEILEAIHQQIREGKGNKIQLPQLYKPDSSNKGNPQAKYAANPIFHASNLLQEQGLITLTRPKTGKAGQPPIEASLTPKGIELMERFHKNGRKSTPEIREALLGTPEE